MQNLFQELKRRNVFKLPYMRNIQTHPDFPALLGKYGLAFEDKSLGVGR